VLTLQKTRNVEIVSTSIETTDAERHLTKEWLLTNSRGGYASSTIIGCNTRRYHGLLIGSLNPPVNRVMALSNCLEMLILKDAAQAEGQKTLNLSTFEFSDKFAPDGFCHIKKFRRDIGVHFEYRFDSLALTRSVYLDCDTDTVALVYDFTHVTQPLEFIVRPFVGLRDFHHLQKAYAQISSHRLPTSLVLRHGTADVCELFLSCPDAEFENDPQWWFNFIYRSDRQRGQEFTEDLWTPGFFRARVNAPCKIVLWASLHSRHGADRAANFDIDALCRKLQEHQSMVIKAAKTDDEKLQKLSQAADQFITRRQTDHKQRTTVLAGFPWFADWGRDAFIALPGLLLATGRVNEAKSVLTTFAAAVDEGMIPNRFDDYGSTAYFNSVDASLWLINAAFEYLAVCGDTQTFTQQLLPTICRIIDSYQKGTRFGICADNDGLITAGSCDTQLTWMDAKYDGVAVTPRHGKAVEINALWYNSLCRLAQFYADANEPDIANRYRSMSEKVKESFIRLFWNETAGFLNDCILPDGSCDATLRPNQIFAVSLAFSPLPVDLQRKIVQVVKDELLTPYGLRTLSPRDNRYRPIYTGSPKERDYAYHQGTVWAYLIGPFVEAWLKVNNFSQDSLKQAAKFIEPLLEHFTEDGCLGQISEIFDGDPPHTPRGCFAQAWSVAELIRAIKLING
jgi:predicted glycogen debranching enzyme